MKLNNMNTLRPAWKILALLLLPATAFADVDWSDALRRMYERYPSARMVTDPQRLQETMNFVDRDAAEKLTKLMSEDPARYDEARQSALQKAPRPKGKGKVIVSGASGAGSVAAKVFAENGYQVEVFESRPVATREVQWGARQELLSAFEHYFGKDAATELTTDVARPIGAAYHHLHLDNQESVYPLAKRETSSSAKLAGKMTGSHIVGSSSVAAVEVKLVENLLRRELAADPNVHLHLGEKVPEIRPLAGGNFGPAADAATPAFVVLGEGAGCASSRGCGIKRVPISPQRLQVAGVISRDIPGGYAVGAESQLSADGKVLVTGSLHRDGSGKIWLVTDLDPAKVKPAASFVAGTPEWKAEEKRLVDLHYREIAAHVLKIPKEEMSRLKVTGATGGELQTFQMQLGISERAVQKNLILVGDNVGNGHWASGAGGMVAMTAHGDGIANYLNDLERGMDPEKAANLLNARLLEDSSAWIRGGIPKFWPTENEDRVRSAYDETMKQYHAHPEETLTGKLEENLARSRTDRRGSRRAHPADPNACAHNFDLLK